MSNEPKLIPKAEAINRLLALKPTNTVEAMEALKDFADNLYIGFEGEVEKARASGFREAIKGMEDVTNA